VEIIGGSLKSVSCVCFEISDPPLIRELAKASHRGVQVTIVSEKRRAGLLLLAAPTFNVGTFQLFLHETNASGIHSLHQKSLIVDDVTAVYGTANLTPQSLDTNDELVVCSQLPGDLNALTRSHDLLARAIDSPSQDLRTVDCTQNGLGENCLSAPVKGMKPGDFVLNFSNDTRLAVTVLDLLRGAQNEITCFASHSIDPLIYRDLRAAQQRGVKITVVKSRSALEWADVRHGFTRVAQSIGRMHVKAIAVDKTIVAFGSLNLFARSLFRDQELLVVSMDLDLNEAILERLGGISKSSESLSRKMSAALAVSYIVSVMRRHLKRWLRDSDSV